MRVLDELITAAVQLAGDDAVSHGARLWQSEGGRACPLGWGGCSQPVYVDLKTGEYDYGQSGGPGHADCMRHCRHGMASPTPDEFEGWPGDSLPQQVPNEHGHLLTTEALWGMYVEDDKPPNVI